MRAAENKEHLMELLLQRGSKIETYDDNDSDTESRSQMQRYHKLNKSATASTRLRIDPREMWESRVA